MFEDPRLKKGVVYLVIAIVIILFLPFLLTRPNFLGFDFTQTGAIGDTIGGLLGPFVAIIAAILTFAAFWVQYKANEQIRRDIRIDRLENRIYEMLSLHRKNVDELSILVKSDEKQVIVAGRNIFPFLFNEFRRIYSIIEKINPFSSEKLSLDLRLKLTEIAYAFFYIGIKDENRIHLISILKKYFDNDLISLFIEKFESVQSVDYVHNLNSDSGSGYDFYKEKTYYQQFNGYLSSLSPYYRHLSQMVKYIDEYPTDILSIKEKYNYVKAIRAQLSDYEQLLLFYGALFPLGKGWIVNRYLVKYKLIKNIPISLANFGVTPQEIFAKEIAENKANGETLFESEE